MRDVDRARMAAMAEQASQRATIAASPQQLFDVVTDFDRYTEWIRDLKSVEVLARDDDGRALEVRYRAAAMGRSTSYTLRYDYSNAPRSLPWKLVSGDIMRRLDGAYEFHGVDGDPDRTDVEYSIAVELIVPLPAFVKRRAESKIMHNALRELKAHVEKQPSS
jgi:ribosome-associated toxin RatA of RatAB toxin-antitoxin module